MRLALDTQSTLGHKTGIGHYTARLLAALRCVAPEHEYVELNWGREVVMRIDRRLRWQQFELPRRARAAHSQLLHVPGFDAPLWKPGPVVLTVHDLIGMLFPRNLPPISRLYWARWLPFTVRAADAIIADSENTRRDLLRLLRLPPEKITVAPLGVDERFRPASQGQKTDSRARYNLPEDFILYVGTLEPRKGIDTLIEAFARLAAEHPHHLVLAGKRGWYWEPILQRIAAHGLEERARVLDYVPDDDLPVLYASAAVFAFPSRYEGFGLPPLEAMACGTPVVCSNAASLPEVIGDAGMMVAPNDVNALARALTQVLGDAHLQAELRERGLRWAPGFTWEQTARQTLEVYHRVLSRGESQ
ncbi:MAG: glycosyltransferase family 4 protein [Anaerolineales bacterium]